MTLTYQLTENINIKFDRHNFLYRLGAIAVDQYRKHNNEEEVLNIINTPKYDKNSDYLFVLKYLNVW